MYINWLYDFLKTCLVSKFKEELKLFLYNESKKSLKNLIIHSFVKYNNSIYNKFGI